jgi:hypothetical protein
MVLVAVLVSVVLEHYGEASDLQGDVNFRIQHERILT